MRILLLFISLNVAGPVNAQLFDDLKKIRNVYYAPGQQIEFGFSYKFYENIDRKVMIDSLKGLYLLSGGNFIFKAGQYTLHRSQKYYIKVDPVAKSITVMPPDNKINADMISGLDTLFKSEGVEVKQVGLSDPKRKTYRLSQPYGTWADSVEITFNRSTYLIEKMVVYLKFNPVEDNYRDEEINKPVLVGNFFNHKISKGPAAGVGLFKENPYLSEHNGKLVLKAKYKGYSLLNRLN